MCSESTVESILPDYPKPIIDPPVFGKAENEYVYAGDCFKLVFNQPYHGNNYSIIFKRRTTLNTLYHIITKMELAKLDDSNLTFNHYYTMRKDKKIIMAARMNIKALNMVSNNESKAVNVLVFAICTDLQREKSKTN